MKMSQSDKGALEALYRNGKQIFFKYAQKFYLAPEVLEDIYQDSFLTLVLNIRNGNYTENGTMLAYLIKICSNKAGVYVRKQCKEKEVLYMAVSEVAASYMNDTEKEEALNITMQLLEEADDVCRQVLSLYYCENKKMDEIAKILQYANGAVAKQKKSSCLKRFAGALRVKLSKVGINWRTKYER